MDLDFIIKKEFFLKVKRTPIEDNYLIHPKKLGQGASGSVYKVKSKDPPVWRAAKSILKTKIKNKEELLHQINILKCLDHPNIIKIYEIYQNQNEIFLIQDLCEGGELFEKLVTVEKFSEADARRIFRQLVEAIYYCHNQHVAHRDLKPENILFLKKDSLDIKIIDFGVSFHWEKSMRKELNSVGKQNFVGTTYYIAPQILIDSNDYDQKCDIWSLGVILYILLTSLPPFDGETPEDIFASIKKYDYHLNTPEMKPISPYVKDLIKKILVPAKNRIDIEGILKHPWMTNEPNPIYIKPNIKTLSNFSKFSRTKKVAASFLASQLQPTEVENLTLIFKQLDLNKDGQISMQELKQALNKEGLGYAELRRIMDSIDTDHNGKINYTEFLAGASGEDLFSEQNIKRAFNMLDKDGNGFVDRKQLIDLFSESGMNTFKGKTIDDILDECDSDKNGVIDFQQFRSVLLKK